MGQDKKMGRGGGYGEGRIMMGDGALMERDRLRAAYGRVMGRVWALDGDGKRAGDAEEVQC